MIPKFRVWDTVKKAMHDVQAIVYTEEKVYPIYSKKIRRYIPFCEAILMQSTGLKDKNDVEIFEGDIVNSCGYDSDEGIIYKTTDFTGVIVYRKNSFCLQCGDFLDSWWANDEEIEVIGNIYQNSDLLESVEE